MLAQGANVNIYVFHGGTSFGWTAGSNTAPFAPCPTSYDYDAPITEVKTQQLSNLTRLTKNRHALDTYNIGWGPDRQVLGPARCGGPLPAAARAAARADQRDGEGELRPGQHGAGSHALVQHRHAGHHQVRDVVCDLTINPS